MKKIYGFIILIFCLILVGCGGKNKEKKTELYFDDTGIAETTHIAYTKEASFDLKTVFKVGNKTSSYNEKKIGETTYDDIFFYIYEWGSEEYITENEDAKINSDGTVTRKKLSTVVIYAALKNEPTNITEDEKANGGMHILTLFFGNEKTFGTWEGDNTYLDLWIQNKIANGETDAKKATITLEFKEDYTYTITITGGYWGTSSYDYKISSKTIKGKLWGLSSAGAVRHDEDDTNGSYDFFLEMNSYNYGEEEKYTLFTGLKLNNGSNSWSNIRFLPKA